MQRKLLLAYVVFLAAFTIVTAERYARYNDVGYFPKSIKRIVIMSDDDCTGVRWDIKDLNKKSVLSGVVGKSVFGKGDHTPCAYNYELDFSSLTTEGVYQFEMQGITGVHLTVAKDPLRQAVASNLRFFYVHRSGSKECLDREPGHFGDSASIIFHRKGKENSDSTWVPDVKRRKVNMLGGWYDGYLYTKYTASIAYATYYLLRSYELYPGLFEKKYTKTDLVDILDNAKCGCDYLMKVMPGDTDFIIQVGGSKDNETGLHLPNKDPLNGKRECYSIISPPQMGLTAAALALGSSVFGRAGKKEDGDRYRQMAIKIFAKAAASQNPPAWLEKDESEYYKDEKSADNLELAAIELFRLTKDNAFLQKAQKYATAAKGAGWIAWSDLNLPAHERVLEHSPQTKKFVLDDLNEFVTTSTGNGNIWNLPIEYTSQGLYSYMEAAAGALLFQMLTNDKKYERMGTHVLDYTLGCNNWGQSFVSLQSVKQSAHNVFSQIYRLQTRLYPEGCIVPGPVDAKTQNEDVWCCFDKTAEPTYQFNTDKVSFFDNSDDESCMSATITGVADGIYLFTVATKIYGE
jgi:endoglucanase